MINVIANVNNIVAPLQNILRETNSGLAPPHYVDVRTHITLSRMEARESPARPPAPIHVFMCTLTGEHGIIYDIILENRKISLKSAKS